MHGAVGSGGFLIQAYEHMKKADLSTKDQQLLKEIHFENEKTSTWICAGCNEYDPTRN